MSNFQNDEYELVVGLEIHVQLSTNSKIFSADSTSFGKAPNENISAITLAHPGTLPKLNKEVVELAAKMGLACNCDIASEFSFDRKNYFYPDLPKGYQLTQDRSPICVNGGVKIHLESGEERTVSLHKIHLEEDAGKSIHDQDVHFSSVDYNRSGVPLIEIVTNPDIYSDKEAIAALQSVRRTVRYLGVSDANMEEGSMRCDANISVKEKGSLTLGNKVEIKNMNSMRNVGRAIRFEFQRQCDLLEKGEKIISETRTFNADKGTTAGMRMKEELNDYRYFPEPDLCHFTLDEQHLNSIKNSMPKLPEEYFAVFTKEYGLSFADASFLVEEGSTAQNALDFISKSVDPKMASNWLLGPIQGYLKEQDIKINEFPIESPRMYELFEMISNGSISHSIATQQLFPLMLTSPDSSPRTLAVDNNLLLEEGNDSLKGAVEEVLAAFPEKVKAYKNGKKALLGMFMGELMKKTGGKVDPKEANKLLRESLEAAVV